MRHARHDRALEAVEKPAKQISPLKYIIIIYDGPEALAREASFVSNVELGDVAAVCDAVAKQVIGHRAN